MLGDDGGGGVWGSDVAGSGKSHGQLFLKVRL